MPTLDVPERLYSQIVEAADGDDIDRAMWQMVHEYQRKQNPAE